MRGFSMRQRGWICLGLMMGCGSIGPTVLHEQHPRYGQAILTSLNEQFLLNLVRLRYRDTPYFLEISSVTQQETLAGSASLSSDLGFGTPAAPSLGRTGVGGSYSRTPTVVFAPLQGEAFVRKMLTPVSLPALLMLTQSGWSIGRVFDIVLDRFEDHVNASSATGPTPLNAPVFEAFHQIVRTLRSLQKANLLNLGLDTATNEQRLILQFTPNENVREELDKMRALLHMAPDQNEITLSDDQVRLDRSKKTLRLRSILGMMFFLSHAIEVPEEHKAAGLVTVTKLVDGVEFDWHKLTGHLFQARVSKGEPVGAYIKVRYRDHWYYVADDDLESKSTFMLLTQLFSLQAGSVTAAGPTLTLPIR